MIVWVRVECPTVRVCCHLFVVAKWCLLPDEHTWVCFVGAFLLLPFFNSRFGGHWGALAVSHVGIHFPTRAAGKHPSFLGRPGGK